MNIFLYGLVVMIWGTTWIAIFLQQQGSVAVPVSIFWRFAIAALVMLLLLRITRRLQPLALRDHLFCILQGGCVFGLNFYCFYHAAAWISSGLESVIFSMAVLFNALNSFIFFRKSPQPGFFPAAVLGMCGMIVLFWTDFTAARLSSSLLVGIASCLLGTYGFSLGNMISTRHQQRGLDILSCNGWAMLYGSLLMAAIALGHGDSFVPETSVRYLGAVLYLALFGSVIGFGAYFTLVGRIGANRAAYSTLLFPLVALTLSTLFEGYQWHGSAVLGLLMILGGNLLMFVRPWQWRPARGQVAREGADLH